jgi:hypothetical protein
LKNSNPSVSSRTSTPPRVSGFKRQISTSGYSESESAARRQRAQEASENSVMPIVIAAASIFAFALFSAYKK